MPWAKNILGKPLPVIHEQGYLIPAIGEVYEQCAQQLANSIRIWHPDAHIKIVTAKDLPRGDQSGFANDWQMYLASPYRETIKLEADMLCSSPIDHWWDLLRKRDVVISQGCRDIYNRVSDCRFYRQLFDSNNLPDVYNAITYWRVSETAIEFWKLVRAVFENWTKFRMLLKFPDEAATTDVVYAIVAQIMGPDRVTLPTTLEQPRITHMKKHIIPIIDNDWTKEMIWEYINGTLRINTVAQYGLVHYHIKDWQP